MNTPTYTLTVDPSGAQSIITTYDCIQEAIFATTTAIKHSGMVSLYVTVGEETGMMMSHLEDPIFECREHCGNEAPSNGAQCDECAGRI